MGYPYEGSGFRTRVDLPRQVYQLCGTENHLSGSTRIDQSLQVMLSGGCGTSTSGTSLYGFTVSATSASTLVVAIGQRPFGGPSHSGFQINPALLPLSSSLIDLELNMGTGEVLRTASSSRYKKDIKPLSYDTYKNILNLTPVEFHWKSNNQKSIGFLAEEADKLGLKDFVAYNEAGLPESIGYKLLTVGLVGLLQNGVKPTVLSTPKEEIEDIPIVIENNYTTTTTRYIIAKKDLTITLDVTTLKRFYIKSMANITIVPINGRIDEEW